MKRLAQDKVADLMNRPATKQGDRLATEQGDRLAQDRSDRLVTDKGEDHFVVVNRSGYI